ncbi:hypothetical protein ACFX15_008342 [Malus domestica]
MARSKAPAKKQQKRGIDFKKIKRKIGRKLPPPKNATNTEIKSKAIVLPEQSVASEKAGLAVNKKGLTLKELLQQTSHYNPKVRKDALLGMKDLLLRYPEELRLHKYAVVEKLRERIGDDDRLVRDMLYQLFKSVILPGCKEDNQELLISLMMAYIFNAMTHLAIDVRLMAFKFLELAIQYHPPSFFLNAEKILQSFEVILRRNQFFLEDKGKLKTALAGLELCLSLLPCNKREVGLCEKNGAGQGILHAFEPDVPAKSAGCSIIIPKLKDLVPVLVNCFQDFIPEVQTGSLLNTQSFDCMLSILNSINLAVKFFFYTTDEGKLESQPSQGGHGPDLEQYVLFRTIEVLNSAYKSGHIQIVDHISFLITLLSRFRVFPGNYIASMLEKIILDQMSQNPPIDNVCAMLRMLITLDSNTMIISQRAFISLGNILPRYLIDVVRCIVEDDKKTTVSISSSSCHYYLIPCFVLFDKSHELLNLVLNTLGSWITESSLPHVTGDHTHYATDISSMVDAVVFLLQLMHMDDKICQIISLFKAEIDYIMEGIRLLESSEEISMTIEEKHKVQCALGRLQNVINTLHGEMQSV